MDKSHGHWHKRRETPLAPSMYPLCLATSSQLTVGSSTAEKKAPRQDLNQATLLSQSRSLTDPLCLPSVQVRLLYVHQGVVIIVGLPDIIYCIPNCVTGDRVFFFQTGSSTRRVADPALEQTLLVTTICSTPNI